MRCVQCNVEDTKVIESRDVASGEAIRRRRECTEGSARFTTYERVERPQLVVIKNNGSRELFSREKLADGLFRACEKTKITGIQIDKLVSDIEQRIYNSEEDEISSSKIGEYVIEYLADLDEVAYVRFASVYKRFSNIAGFERELAQIRNKKIY